MNLPASSSGSMRGSFPAAGRKKSCQRRNRHTGWAGRCLARQVTETRSHFHHGRRRKMPQVINTNAASLNSQRSLNMSQTSLATSLQRLSSGLRINSAKDDAAGMAISARMTSQINGSIRHRATPTTASRWRRRPKAACRASPSRCSGCANWPCRAPTRPTPPRTAPRCSRKSTSWYSRSTPSPGRPRSTASSCLTAPSTRRLSRSAPTAVKRFRSTRSPAPEPIRSASARPPRTRQRRPGQPPTASSPPAVSPSTATASDRASVTASPRR
jgi:hypothetical protein